MKPRLFALTFVVGLAAIFVSPLSAHTEVWQRSPEMGQAYGGTIDRVQISFFATVVSSDITITDPSGNPVPVGETTLARGDRIAVVEFPELTESGAYVVTHSEMAEDGDLQTATFQFFFDPSVSREVTTLILGDDGPNWVLLGIIAGVVLIMAGIFWPGRTSKT